MTPKEKAEDLFYKYLIYFPEFYNDLEYDYNPEDAKQCALIAVDELINNSIEWLGCKYQDEEIKYWQEVKQEIEKL
jgi:hypothetical protein